MDYIQRFRKKMAFDGGNNRQELINYAKRYLDETFYDDPSYMTSIYPWEFGKDPLVSAPIPIRLYNRRFSNANGVVIEFKTPYANPLRWGDVVLDNKTGEYYICTEVFDENEINWAGKLTQCNWMLKWQDSDGNILEYPAIDMNTTQYNAGETSNRQFTIGTAQHLLQLTYDKNTIKLRTPIRFFLDRYAEEPVVYKISQNDNTSYGYDKKGIVRITAMQDVYNPATDRIDLGVCDYREPDDDESTVEDLNVNIIPSSLVIKSGGDAQVYTARFFDGDDKDVELTPVWEIISDFSSKLKISEENKAIKISADDDSLVDEEFRLTCSDEAGTVSASVVIKIESLL